RPPDASDARSDADAASDAGTEGSTPPSPTFDAAAVQAAVGPPHSVAQRVHLVPGNYFLSWWDEARNADGTLRTNAASGPDPSPYRAGLFDLAAKLVSGTTVIPFVPMVDTQTMGPPSTPSQLWSARHTLSISITEEADYVVAFGPSLDGTGSVALGGVQLEAANLPNGQLNPFTPTGASRDYVSGVCHDKTAADV